MRHWGVATPHTATYRVRLLLAEDYWKQPGERVFDVRAEGKTVAEGVDAAAAVGAGVAHEVSFTTRVVDGVLSLDFVPIRDNPAISAIEVTSTDPALIGLGSIPRKAVTLSPTSFYTTDIRDAPVAENSDLIVADLTAQVARQWEGVAAVNAYQYNTAFYTVAPGAATTTVAFDDCQKKGYVPSGLFDGPAYFVDVPVPPDAQATAGTDAQLTVYDPAADKIWEFWQMRRAPSGGWQACWGGRIDDVSTSQGIFPEPYGASASGLLMAPGMISIDEARLRRIDHAMYLAVHDTRAGAFSWPANRTDGDTDDENVVAEGQRLRLDPSLDVTKLGLSPFATMVARAAQKYGFVVADRAHAVAVVTESGAAMKRETGSDPWDGLLGGPSYSVLKGFPWDKLQALPLDHGRP